MVLLMVLFCIPILFGQQALQGEKISYSHPELATTFSSYEVHELEMTELSSLTSGADQEALLFNLAIGSFNWQLNLVSNPLIAPGLQTTVLTENGVEYWDINKTHTYKGYVNGDPDSKVRMSIYEDRIIGMVKTNEEEYFIEPLATLLSDNTISPDRYVLYNVKDVVADPSIKCGSVAAHSNNGQQQHLHSGQSGSGSSGSVLMTCMEVDFALAAAFDMVDKFGNVADVQTHILDITNMMEALYDDFMLTYIVTEIVIPATLAADPWTRSPQMDELLDETDPPFDMLPGFEPWAATGFINPHDIGQLWVARDVISDVTGTGLAGRAGGIGVVCTPQQYNVCEDYTTDMNRLRVLSAHENGHLWDGEHRLSDDGTTIMSPTIVAAATDWSADNITQMQAHIDSRTCLSACGCDITITGSAAMPTSCIGADDGTITITATSADPITYSIAGPDGPAPVATNTTGIFTGLAPGNYSARAELTTGPTCTEVVNIEVLDAACTVSIDGANATAPSCPGTDDGSLVVTSSACGGSINFSTAGSFTVTLTTPGGNISRINRSPTTFNGLAPGSYALRLENDADATCFVTSVVVIPEAACDISIDGVTAMGESCINAADGSITAVASHCGTFNYRLTGPDGPAVVGTNTTGMFTGLDVGVYVITATSDADANCSTMVSAEIMPGNDLVVDCSNIQNQDLACVEDLPAANTSLVTVLESCGVATVTSGDIQNTGTGCPGSPILINRTYVISDGVNTDEECSQLFTIESTNGPTITFCPVNITVNCGADISLTALGTATATQECDLVGGNIVVIGSQDTTTPGACPQESSVRRVFTATDVCGRTSTCEQIIIIQDGAPPVLTIPANTTAECDDDYTPTAAGAGIATATDNCGGLVNITSADVIVPGGTCPQIFMIQRTWTATDECGLSTQDVQMISITDSDAPVITCPLNATISCEEDRTPGALGFATATDNCDADVAITFADNFVAGACPQAGILTRTWTATDDCGLTMTCDQIITITDIVDPIILTCPSNMNIECDQPTSPDFTGRPVAVDNCDLEVASSFFDVMTPGVCAQEMTITRTWTVRDDCGNTAACVQILNITDETAPIITCPESTIVECDQDTTPFTGVTGVATAVDNCDPTPIITTLPDFIIPGDCVNEFTIERTWVATDDCGNSTSCTQTIFVQDTTDPVITCPADVTIECDVDRSPATNGTATATDNCTADGDIIIEFNDVIIPGPCANTFTIERTWTATDECELFSTCLQIINVEDTTPPVAPAPPADITVQCPQDIPVPIELTAIDNCAGPITVLPTSRITNRECATRFTFTYTWTFDDGCGNVTAISQVITVIDTEPLVLNSSPPDQVVDCQVNVIPQEHLVDAMSPCENPLTITSSISDPIGPLGCNGTRYIITYTISDDCGRVITTTQTYTIQNEGPEILCGNEVCYLPCTVSGTELMATFNEFAERAVVVDACEESVFTVTNNFNPNSLGDCGSVLVVTFTATDACGRTGTCTAPVVVVDDEAPTVSGSVPTAIRNCSDINGLQYISWINSTIADLNATDNCGAVSASYQPLMPNTTFEEGFPFARTNVTFTFSDECGNDLEVPGVYNLRSTAPAFVGELEDQMITCPATPAFDTPVFVNGCSGGTLTFVDDSSGGSCPGGYTVTRTWTVTDDTGAGSTIQQTIFVMGSNTQMSTVAGLIITEMDEPVEDVAVSLNYSGTSFAQEEMTAEDGLYNFATPTNNDYEIQPNRNNDPLNGVTTYDLILLGQHLLDIQSLNSPYQMIAADVNKSGTISSLDMIALRRLILLIDEEFNNNTSWRFVDAAYEFTDTSNPFAQTFPETATVNDLVNEMASDFIAVKVGDLNNSAQPNQLASGDTRSKDADLIFQLEDQLVDAGETFSVSFNATDFDEILGYQFTLKYNADQVNFEDMEPYELRSLNADNFGVRVDEGIITTSWNRETPLSLTKGSTAFTLTFTAKEPVRISEVISLHDAYTPAEAYNAADGLMDVQLRFREASVDEKSAFRLFQNQPNPFRTETKISFQLPENGMATLVIYDVAGRMLKSMTKEYAAGYNEEVIERSELNATGILFYQLSTDYGVATKKMILK